MTSKLRDVGGNGAVDPFTAEVIRSALVAITGEMKTNLMRTAYHTIIYEAEDFTVGLFDADGDTISIGLGLPMFIRGLSDAIKAKLAYYGKENIQPGDILVTTDSYEEGLQLPIVKIYRQGVLNDELAAIIRANVRFPDLAMGDFRAQIASIKTGERRFVQLLQRYGRDAVLGSIQHIYRHSEAVARQAVR